MVILVCYECIMICIQSLTHKEPPKSFMSASRQNVPNANLPSVYFIVLDEYAGSETLEKYFKYSNAGFVNTLDSLGFKVIRNASSNYHYTVLSMASTLNGEYIETHKNKPVYTQESFRNGMNAIYYNKAFATFEELGYSVFNYSPFRMKEHASRYSNRFLPTDYWLILHPTFFDRVIESFPYFFARKSGNKNLLKNLFTRQVDVSRNVLNDVLNKSGENLNAPTFSYIHLMMPHAPYATDSTGMINMAFLTSEAITKKQRMDAYLQYLVYANRVVSDFLRKIKTKTNGNAVVMLMSDHGLRDQLNPEDTISKFNSLNAVYLPAGMPNKWYDNMSNVNQFRLLFSLLSQQQIEYKQDLQVH
ncbi:sulfatase-like hydrolase/transferase [Lacibacter sp. H375]|uniref:sulfatase-like hydrolase/transferase n=1 Tax=Lacibacter sp. H375 TaxID=3133424 RepID=UPI0030BCAABB